MCVLSGMNSARLLRARRSTTRITSRHGTISTLNDTSTGLVFIVSSISGSYIQYLMTKKLRIYPSVKLPVSPMKIFLPKSALPNTLYEKNGIITPTVTKASMA